MWTIIAIIYPIIGFVIVAINAGRKWGLWVISPIGWFWMCIVASVWPAYVIDLIIHKGHSSLDMDSPNW